MAADYLGPQGLATYTVQGTLRTLKQRYNVQCHEDDLDKVMLFSPHWSGFGGILRGTDCGDEPIEAFHVPWQAQLGVLGSDAEGVQVLATMQRLYEGWSAQSAWKSSDRIGTVPPGRDDSLLHGAALLKVGRFPALTIWEASKTSKVYHVVRERA